MSSANSINELAQELDTAWRSRVAISPLTETHADLSVSDAYKIQSRWTELRQSRGEEIVGRKIGLTSKAIQQQLGVSEPDYGALWRSSFFVAADGRVEIPTSEFLQPRIEGEVAFLIRDELSGSGITADDVLAATEACALGVEIVDSRISNWRIKLVDTIADNASYGGFTLGPWNRDLPLTDLSALEMQIRLNGVLAAEGVGAAALGHPARSTAWLINKLHELGVTLKPGDIVISGGITKMLPVSPGDEFVFSLTGQPDLAVAFR
jgi:2-keto-4-pentenoate hydratase